jgi:hypothetical protein
MSEKKMRTTALLLSLIVCNSTAFFYDILTVFASNNNSTFNHTNPSNDASIKNISPYTATCANFHSVSCRLPSCDVQPIQKGCPLKATKANSTSIDNTLRQLQNH